MRASRTLPARRARDLERYHRRTAERKAKGLCLKCGKRPPAPHRSQCEVCTAKCRPADLANGITGVPPSASPRACARSAGSSRPAPDRSAVRAVQREDQPRQPRPRRPAACRGKTQTEHESRARI